MPRNKAVTIVEIITVVIVIAVVAALAMPMFGKTFEAARAKQALAALQQIRTGERVYRNRDGFYYPYAPGSVSDIGTINNYLKIYIYRHPGRTWDFSIGSSSGSDFQATATRRGGSPTYNNKTIVIDQTGTVLPQSTWPLPLPADVR